MPRHRYIRSFVQAASPGRVLLGLTVAFLIISFSVLWSQRGLLVWQWQITESVGEWLALVVSLYGGLATNYTWWGAGVLVTIALLAGVQVMLLAYYLSTQRTLRGTGRFASGLSLSGLVAGLAGVGCAACGSVLATVVVSWLGLAGLLSILPFQGQEFGLLGIVILFFVNKLLLRRIADPAVCRVE